MPHLENCHHVDDGWCSECVAKQGEENLAFRERIAALERERDALKEQLKNATETCDVMERVQHALEDRHSTVCRRYEDGRKRLETDKAKLREALVPLVARLDAECEDDDTEIIEAARAALKETAE